MKKHGGEAERWRSAEADKRPEDNQRRLDDDARVLFQHLEPRRPSRKRISDNVPEKVPDNVPDNVPESIAGDGSRAPASRNRTAALEGHKKEQIDYKAGHKAARKAHDDKVGHRARLRARFLSQSESLADYELLELALAMVQPRKDTKPCAKALLRQFKTLAAVLKASPSELRQVKDLGEISIVQLRLVYALALRLSQHEIQNKNVIGSWDQLLSYCLHLAENEKKEHFWIISLNSRHCVLNTHLISEGTLDRVSVYPREIAHKLFSDGASSVVLLHNHPSGDPTPSKADIQLTDHIERALKPFEVSVHDHVIVAAGAYQTFRTLGLLK